MTASLAATWRPRAEPLAPAAVVAADAVAPRLVDRLLALADDALARLRGVANASLVVLTGDPTDLPWLDGVVYLGRDPAAPTMYIPTTLEPSVPAALLERALRRRSPTLTPPLAVLLDPPRLVSLADARPLSRARLRAWRGVA